MAHDLSVKLDPFHELCLTVLLMRVCEQHRFGISDACRGRCDAAARDQFREWYEVPPVARCSFSGRALVVSVTSGGRDPGPGDSWRIVEPEIQYISVSGTVNV